MTSHVDLTYVSKYAAFWGNVTSTLDWCEFSSYIAELANTISNIAIISLGLYGYIRCKQQSLPALYSTNYLGLLMVGIGSAAFHGSLLYEAQLADELPITFIYRNPVYHQAVFATLMLLNTYRTMKLRRQTVVPLSRNVQSQVVKIFWTGGLSFIVAFLIWNLDNIFCGNLQGWKKIIGWPTAFLLEGQAA
ncbi:hypothetical protein Clacol_009938 [Clathrus columnatus]|uniref:Alkaline ceramidase n=1 Tax=Clathrus columnatus TaxID=1419009 RepID=A0AAV5AMK4_9AGAM|nr:hypothetical protein Clacol_009938 [Clathrus columnatus]